MTLATQIRTKLLGILGQSNEAGTTGRFQTIFGWLLNLSADGGVAGSMFMRLCEMISAWVGHVIIPVWGAYGGSSVKSYAGYCEGAWSAGKYCRAGVVVTSDGGAWSLFGGDGTKIGFSYTTGAAGNAPTGTANITTGDGLTWKYLGAATAKDVLGTVYAAGDTGRFDPLGRMATTTLAAIVSQAANIDDSILILQWGQSDAPDTSVTAPVYAQTHINIIQAHLDAGYKHAFVGLSVYNGAADGFYTTKLYQAIELIMAYFANDPRVKRGANLRAVMGVLPASPGTGNVGMEATLTHVNNEGLYPAAKAWFNVLLNATPSNGVSVL